MIEVIKPKVPYLKKPWILILNQQILKDKIEKKNSIIQKDWKQNVTIIRMNIKIKIQNKFYIWLKIQIEKKI